ALIVAGPQAGLAHADALGVGREPGVAVDLLTGRAGALGLGLAAVGRVAVAVVPQALAVAHRAHAVDAQILGVGEVRARVCVARSAVVDVVRELLAVATAAAEPGLAGLLSGATGHALAGLADRAERAVHVHHAARAGIVVAAHEVVGTVLVVVAADHALVVGGAVLADVTDVLAGRARDTLAAAITDRRVVVDAVGVGLAWSFVAVAVAGGIAVAVAGGIAVAGRIADRKSTRLNSSHV